MRRLRRNDHVMPGQPLPPPARRPVVLIVDGHEDTRQLYALALSTFGFDTVSVEDSRMAFPRALEAYPDVIITELSMPERDGWHLWRPHQGARVARAVEDARG